jgi:hypothetical protein
MKLAVAALLAVAGLGAIPIQASAQAWPTKPVTLVVPFPPGRQAQVDWGHLGTVTVNGERHRVSGSRLRSGTAG